ncbi:MAG: response regulator [Candidatus Binatia bacterium]|jgi:PAS domain S-box-containing protein
MSQRHVLKSARAHLGFPFPAHYLEQLVESSPDIVVAADRAGTIVFYNDGAEKNLGYSAAEILGENVTKLYSSIEEALRVMEAMRSDEWGGPGKVKNFETVFVDRWGQRLPVAISGSILYDDAGLEIGSIGFAKDIHEIRRRDRLATLGEVAVAVCHEINNPLEVILNQIELVDHFICDAASDERAVVEEERVEAVRREVNKIQQIINRLVEMAKGSQYGTREYHAGMQMTDLVPRSGPSGERTLEGLRILVVDDDLGVCRSIHDLLAEEGCEVIMASGGREALKVLERVSVDLVISDVVMPDLDGYDLFVEVKRRGPTPVLLMTGYYYDRDHVIKRSRLEGLEGVLFKKPVDPERLKTLVRQLCRRPAAGAAASV